MVDYRRMEASQPPLRVLVAQFGSVEQAGIYLTELNSESGELKAARRVASLKNASFLAIHPSGRYAFCTCEMEGYEESDSGALAAFRVDPASGDLDLINHQASGGKGPHYVSLDRQGRNALVANYHGGSVSVLPICADGSLKASSSTVRHFGAGANPDRQEAPHPHGFDVDPTGRFAIVPDLGLDRLAVYRFDPSAGSINAVNDAGAATHAGAGPRHITFHPSGRWAYVINELDCTVDAWSLNSGAGELTHLETYSTLPADATPGSIGGELAIHPNGRLLYASNRGHDSIAVFKIDTSSGRLTLVGCHSAGGRTPRNFALDPTGRFLLCANLDSGSITVHYVNSVDGSLTQAPSELQLTNPYCIAFLPR